MLNIKKKYNSPTGQLRFSGPDLNTGQVEDARGRILGVNILIYVS